MYDAAAAASSMMSLMLNQLVCAEIKLMTSIKAALKVFLCVYTHILLKMRRKSRDCLK